MNDRRVITVTVGEWRGTYHGGAYIDIAHVSRPGSAVDCINVYDYAEGQPLIPFTREAVREEIIDWIPENAECFLVNAVPYL